MKIAEIVEMLEDRIDGRMQEFKQYSSIIYDMKHDPKGYDQFSFERNELYIALIHKMMEIVQELRPVESLIREQMPHINDLLDILLVMHAEYKKEVELGLDKELDKEIPDAQ